MDCSSITDFQQSTAIRIAKKFRNLHIGISLGQPFDYMGLLQDFDFQTTSYLHPLQLGTDPAAAHTFSLTLITHPKTLQSMHHSRIQDIMADPYLVEPLTCPGASSLLSIFSRGENLPQGHYYRSPQQD